MNFRHLQKLSVLYNTLLRTRRFPNPRNLIQTAITEATESVLPSCAPKCCQQQSQSSGPSSSNKTACYSTFAPRLLPAVTRRRYSATKSASKMTRNYKGNTKSGCVSRKKLEKLSATRGETKKTNRVVCATSNTPLKKSRARYTEEVKLKKILSTLIRDCKKYNNSFPRRSESGLGLLSSARSAEYIIRKEQLRNDADRSTRNKKITPSPKQVIAIKEPRRFYSIKKSKTELTTIKEPRRFYSKKSKTKFPSQGESVSSIKDKKRIYPPPKKPRRPSEKDLQEPIVASSCPEPPRVEDPQGLPFYYRRVVVEGEDDESAKEEFQRVYFLYPNKEIKHNTSGTLENVSKSTDKSKHGAEVEYVKEVFTKSVERISEDEYNNAVDNSLKKHVEEEYRKNLVYKKSNKNSQDYSNSKQNNVTVEYKRKISTKSADVLLAENIQEGDNVLRTTTISECEIMNEDSPILAEPSRKEKDKFYTETINCDLDYSERVSLELEAKFDLEKTPYSAELDNTLIATDDKIFQYIKARDTADLKFASNTTRDEELNSSPKQEAWEHSLNEIGMTFENEDMEIRKKVDPAKIQDEEEINLAQEQEKQSQKTYLNEIGKTLHKNKSLELKEAMEASKQELEKELNLYTNQNNLVWNVPSTRTGIEQSAAKENLEVRNKTATANLEHFVASQHIETKSKPTKLPWEMSLYEFGRKLFSKNPSEARTSEKKNEYIPDFQEYKPAHNPKLVNNDKFKHILADFVRSGMKYRASEENLIKFEGSVSQRKYQEAFNKTYQENQSNTSGAEERLHHLVNRKKINEESLKDGCDPTVAKRPIIPVGIRKNNVYKAKDVAELAKLPKTKSSHILIDPAHERLPFEETTDYNCPTETKRPIIPVGIRKNNVYTAKDVAELAKLPKTKSSHILIDPAHERLPFEETTDYSCLSVPKKSNIPISVCRNKNASEHSRLSKIKSSHLFMNPDNNRLPYKDLDAFKFPITVPIKEDTNKKRSEKVLEKAAVENSKKLSLAEKKKIIICPQIKDKEDDSVAFDTNPIGRVSIILPTIQMPFGFQRKVDTTKINLNVETKKCRPKTADGNLTLLLEPLKNFADAKKDALSKVEKICKEELKSLQARNVLDEESTEDRCELSHRDRQRANFSKFVEAPKDNNENLSKNLDATQNAKNEEETNKPRKILSVIDKIWHEVEQEAMKTIKGLENTPPMSDVTPKEMEIETTSEEASKTEEQGQNKSEIQPNQQLFQDTNTQQLKSISDLKSKAAKQLEEHHAYASQNLLEMKKDELMEKQGYKLGNSEDQTDFPNQQPSKKPSPTITVTPSEQLNERQLYVSQNLIEMKKAELLDEKGFGSVTKTEALTNIINKKSRKKSSPSLVLLIGPSKYFIRRVQSAPKLTDSSKKWLSGKVSSSSGKESKKEKEKKSDCKKTSKDDPFQRCKPDPYKNKQKRTCPRTSPCDLRFNMKASDCMSCTPQSPGKNPCKKATSTCVKDICEMINYEVQHKPPGCCPPPKPNPCKKKKSSSSCKKKKSSSSCCKKKSSSSCCKKKKRSTSPCGEKKFDPCKKDPCKKKSTSSCCSKTSKSPCDTKETKICKKKITSSAVCPRRTSSAGCPKRTSSPCDEKKKDPCKKSSSSACDEKNLCKKKSTSSFGQPKKKKSTSSCCSKKSSSPCGKKKKDPCKKKSTSSCCKPKKKKSTSSCCKPKKKKSTSSCCSKKSSSPCGKKKKDPCKKRSTSSCCQPKKKKSTSSASLCGKKKKDPCKKKSTSSCCPPIKKKSTSSCCKPKKKKSTSSCCSKKSASPCGEKKKDPCKKKSTSSCCRPKKKKSTSSCKRDPCKKKKLVRKDAFNYVCRKGADGTRNKDEFSNMCRKTESICKAPEPRVCPPPKKKKFDPCKGLGLPKKTAVKKGIKHCKGNRLGPKKVKRNPCKKRKKKPSVCSIKPKKRNPCKKNPCKKNPCKKKKKSSVKCKGPSTKNKITKKQDPCKWRKSISKKKEKKSRKPKFLCKKKPLPPKSKSMKSKECQKKKPRKGKSKKSKLTGPACKKAKSDSALCKKSAKQSKCKLASPSKKTSAISCKSSKCKKPSKSKFPKPICKKPSSKKSKSDPCVSVYRKKEKKEKKKKSNDPCAPSPCKKPSSKSIPPPCKKPEKKKSKVDPCKPKKRKESPCKPAKRKESPCKPKKRKESPCKREDPCKPKEDPCKKKEDPCKPKDPCKDLSSPTKKFNKKWLTSTVPEKVECAPPPKKEKKAKSMLPSPSCAKASKCAGSRKKKPTLLTPGASPTLSEVKICSPIQPARDCSKKSATGKRSKSKLPAPTCGKVGSKAKKKSSNLPPPTCKKDDKKGGKAGKKTVKKAKSVDCHPGMKMEAKPKIADPSASIASMTEDPAVKFQKLKMKMYRCSSEPNMYSRDDVLRKKTPFEPPRIYKVQQYKFTILGPKVKAKDTFGAVCRRKKRAMKMPPPPNDKIVCNDLKRCSSAKKVDVDDKYLDEVEEMIEEKKCISKSNMKKIPKVQERTEEQCPRYLQILKKLQNKSRYDPGPFQKKNKKKKERSKHDSSRCSKTKFP